MRKVSVLRKGQWIDLHRDNVLVGDIAKIESGMEIPADGIVIEGQDITTNESLMTGEPDPVPKADLNKCIKKRNEIK